MLNFIVRGILGHIKQYDLGDIMTGVIYKITNLVTLKIYIGSTKDFGKRQRQHLKMLRTGKHHSVKLQRSFDKHGEPNFKFEVMYLSENIKVDEQKELDRLDFSNAYNIATSSEGCFTKEDHPNKTEMIRKLSEGRKGIKPTNRVKVLITDVEYDSINEASRQLNIPVVTIRYRCLSLNQKYRDWNILGKKKSNLYREGSQQGIAIYCDGVIFDSYAEAARNLGITDTSVKYRVKSNNYPNYYEQMPRD